MYPTHSLNRYQLFATLVSYPPPTLFQISQGLSTHIYIFSTQRCLLTVSLQKLESKPKSPHCFKNILLRTKSRKRCGVNNEKLKATIGHQNTHRRVKNKININWKGKKQQSALYQHFSDFAMHTNHLGFLINENCNSLGMGRGLRVCISNS